MNKIEYKVLIADDSELSIKIISEVLEILGNKVNLYSAKDGKDACEQANKIIPDLIIMDVLMPVMNGIDAIKKLRKNSLTSEIPIIVLSATESLESAYEAGANDFILKPFNRFELLIKVRSALHLVQKIKEIKLQKSILEKNHLEVTRQRDEIALQKKDIVDDIRYSKRIQKAIFPTDEYMQETIPRHFILNMPRNIVSGDFYWAGRIEDLRIIAVGDCTGHGISGAFMTMAGIAFLNEILSKKIAVKANEILFELRKLVMKLLKQKGEQGEAADGLDISLVIIDEKNKKIQFAGANNLFYRIANGELNSIKGDRMPIGIHLNFDKPFTNHDIEINKGDLIYLFTDGFADQFGGPRNKKFRYKQFQELLLKIHTMEMDEQKEILSRTITDWMGDNEQIDDILILGFKV
ncbi:MAG: response regulator [Bacteroidales bacterium]|jgi:sigma-B regulation protein RsbU (phosphoserine phosphatase)|nr:response regulator [Bacteroidales bacterium]